MDGFRCRGRLGESDMQQLVGFLTDPQELVCVAAKDEILHAMWRISEQISSATWTASGSGI